RGAVLSRWQATPHAGPALARLAVRTSMRNQWPCVVQRLEDLGQIVRVHLALANGAAGAVLAARITRESAELLGLAPGLPVQALCKATAVRVERAAAAAQPGLCVLPGKAVRVVRGASGDEVAAALDGGLQAVGFAAPGSGLRAGSRVALAVEDNAVVLALADL
ncbi:MAG: TOBE domain-containing protein, partial [Acidovorax sp.]|uniref:TOBE domain-containing protein n=1 Tax=Acidovorax sp. TaxID=1872122 RepID=UPI0039E2B376